MTVEDPGTAVDGPGAGPAAEPVPPPARVRLPGLRRALARRWVKRVAAGLVAILAAVFVGTFSIDLGRFPRIKQLAEAQAANYLERPIRIGRISAMLWPGSFSLEDVVIEGRSPGDRPFMTIGRVDLHVQWRTIIYHRIFADVTLHDWRMVVERWSDGKHNVPKLTPKPNPDAKPSRYPTTTTVDFVHAHDGEFIYEDHGTPWGVVARNLSFSLVWSNLGQYVGRTEFSNGSVQILNYRPMRVDMTNRFVLEMGKAGNLVRLTHLDLLTDGTESHISGAIDFKRWPEQTYNVSSRIDFATMREVFFPNEKWRLSGEGRFAGIFHLPKDGGRDLTGEFTSELAGVDRLVFAMLHGTLNWTNERFAVTHADAQFLGGDTRFAYSLAPLGTPRPATATFSADYHQLDAESVGQLIDLADFMPTGRMDGSLSMAWPNGHFSERRGDGHTFVSAPAGTVLASAVLPTAIRAPRETPGPYKQFSGSTPMGRVPLGADVHYTIDPQGWTFDDGWAATEWTHVKFSGRMASQGESDFPFHVTSHDWQESDRVLAGIMSAVNGPTGAVRVGGHGLFDGRMTGRFSAPRIAGRFTGEALNVWDVTWGRAAADLVIQGGFVDIARSDITDTTGGRIVADGRYALGFRPEATEEIRSHVTLTQWPMADLRHAFDLDDWPMDGTIALADLDLRGRYKNMFGSGKLRIEKGSAWKEPFDAATGDVELLGSGMQITRIELTKGSSGIARGAARVNWRDSTYVFNADGDRFPVESLENFKFETFPLTGVLKFKASGAGAFASPVYDVEASVADLFAGDEGIGQVSGRMTVRNNTMTFERINMASSRLQVFGSGSIAINDLSDADLLFRFQETSIDPYLRFIAPEMSPYTRAIVSGSLQVRGPLGDPARLLVDTTIDSANITLRDYMLTNDGPIHLTLEDEKYQVGRLRLKGTDTALEVTGGYDQGTGRVDATARGDASLAVLQLFFPTTFASGGASLSARLTGPTNALELSGSATITNGRLRQFSLEQSLSDIQGRITFDKAGINLSGLRARMGEGPIVFGGTIGLDEGFKLGEFNLTANGEQMRLRYPEGFRSTVNADLTLKGTLEALVLAGDVDVVETAYVAPIETNNLLGLAAGGALSGGGVVAPALLTVDSGVPLQYNIRFHMPSMSVVKSRTANMSGSADLTFGGTYDRPTLSGRVIIEDGDVTFSGNRYTIRGGSIDFRANGSRINPYFDIEAETRARADRQTVVVTLRVSGTMDSLRGTLESDPYLPEADILSLLLGAEPNLDQAEQRRLSPQAAQTRLFETLTAAALSAPLTSRVGSVFEDILPIQSVQITTALNSSESFQQLNPSARITLGQRLSSRLYLTYSREVTGPTQNEIILLEYDQNDRISWVLSRNEDRTFALDFRVRYVF